MATLSIKALLEAGTHFGHQTRNWNPKMSRYIYGSRNNIHIIDLQKTIKELRRSLDFLEKCASENKVILFVGTKKQAKDAVVSEAKRAGCPYVAERWLGGTLTNFETVHRSVQRLHELSRMKQDGVFGFLPKKEVARLEKELKRLNKSLDGLKDMTSAPSCLFVIDPITESITVKEAKKMDLTVVAVCDTNSNPDMVDYVIPGNDDGIRSVRLFCELAADAIIKGKQMLSKAVSTEELSSEKMEGSSESVQVPAFSVSAPDSKESV